MPPVNAFTGGDGRIWTDWPLPHMFVYNSQGVALEAANGGDRLSGGRRVRQEAAPVRVKQIGPPGRPALVTLCANSDGGLHTLDPLVRH